MNIRETVWDLDLHTIGKHRVLGRYLKAWIPILARAKDYGMFIDGFSGPGEYTKREPGSPLIALRTLQEHSAFDDLKHKIRFRLIEERPDRSAHLESLLATESVLPSEQIEVRNSTFDADMGRFLDQLDSQGDKPPPMFVMIDPFGFSDAPMDTVGRILGNESAEVYISFMYRDIHRFLTDPGKEHALDLHFGGTEWQQSRGIEDKEEHKDFLHNLYREQLKSNGADYVLHFEIYDQNTHIYSIFFGTNNLKGCDEMKKAIWKVMPQGNFRFRGNLADQFFLGDGIVNFDTLRQDLREAFNTDEWTPIEALQAFVMSDQTGFHSGHLKDKTLRPMEAVGELEARKEGGRRRGRFTEGTEVRFIKPEFNLQRNLL